jgi:hypothetical protein
MKGDVVVEQQWDDGVILVLIVGCSVVLVVSSVIEQQSNDSLMPFQGYHMQRRLAVLALGLDVGTVIEQQPNGSRTPSRYCHRSLWPQCRLQLLKTIQESIPIAQGLQSSML